MVLPTCNVKLRAEATQRANILRARMFGEEELETSSAEDKLVQLLIAEICFNLDLEVMKARIEGSDGGFSTQRTFELLDIRDYRYLDMEGIQVFMEHYFKYMITRQNGYDPSTTAGTGLYLETNPKFYNAIMRRLGLGVTRKIDYREFAKILKPCKPANMLKTFAHRSEQGRDNDI